MIEAVLVVLSKPLPGRGADFEDWYTNIHLRDALRFRGSIAAQRFRRSEVQSHTLPDSFDWRSLALYDVFDPARFSREHWESVDTDRMKISDAFDDSVLEDYHYYPLAFRDHEPGTEHRGGVILERMNPAAGRDDDFAWAYLRDVFAAAIDRPGVRSGALLMYRPEGQLMPGAASHAYVAIYRIDDPAAVAAWRDAPPIDPALVDHASLLVSHWEPITRRITEDDVLYSDAEGIAREAAARDRMGDRIHRGGEEKLATPQGAGR